MLRIYDKGNNRNFIGWGKNNESFELIKMSGRLYLCKYVFGEGIIPQGNPLVEGKDFIYGN